MFKDFEVLPHTADIKIRVYGKSLSDFFSNALIGMFQAIGPKVDNKIYDCKKNEGRLICKNLPMERIIELDAIDPEVLLVDFLSQALYFSDVNNEAYLDARINYITGFDEANFSSMLDFLKMRDENLGGKVKISANIYGVKVKGFEVVEIKAVTYNDLKIEKIDGIWQSDIVFDI